MRTAALWLALTISVRANDFMNPHQAVVIDSARINEASGMAVSSWNTAFVWLINDSGSGSIIHLCGIDGRPRGTVRLTHAKNVDWEDIASFTWDGKPWLLIADTGDNASRRTDCTLYLLPEPQLPAAGETLDLPVTASLVLPIAYEKGPRDCEAVAVDATTKTILLLTKRTSPPELYEFPLGRDGGTARLVGTATVSEPPGSFPVPYSKQPTGLSLSGDGTLAAVVTYYGVFLFSRAPEESWAAAFAGKPRLLGRHGLPQAEAISFSKDGRSLYVTSEGAKPSMLIYQK